MEREEVKADTGGGRGRASLAGLLRRGNFSLLWSSTFTSQLGDHLNLMALAALIFSLSGGATRGFEFSKILLLASAPVLIFGPISGVYADRLSRKKMMIVSDLLRAGLVATIPLLINSMVLVYVIVFLVFTINRFYLSARSAAMPQIVSDSELMAANSLLNVAMMATIMIGPWGGGILVERFGFTFGFLADAGTYVVSALLAAFIVFRSISEIEAARARAASARRKALGDSARHALRATSPVELGKEAAKVGREIAAPIEEEVERIGSTYRHLVTDLREGLATMKGSRPVIHATVSVSAMMFVAGFVLVVCPVLVKNEFGMGTSQLGMLYSVAGIGMLVGSLIVGRFLHEAPRRAIIAASFFVSGIAIAMISVVRSIPAVGGWIFALGLFVAPTMVTCDTVLQENMPAESVGKAFGFRDMLSKAAFGIAGILSGIIVDTVGPRALFAVVALGSVAYAGASIFLFADTSKLNLLNAYPLMRAGSGLAAGLPRRLSYGLATVLSDLAYFLLAEKRRCARENSARVLGAAPDSREARALARRMFRSYGLYWADFFLLNGRHARGLRSLVRVEGLEHLRAALGRGRGAIFVSAHIGSWDVGAAALAGTCGIQGLSAVVEPVSKGPSNVAMTTMREARGIKVIPLGRFLGVGRALRRNEIVFVLGERLVGADGVEVEFFGRKTLFPRGAAYWALRSGASIVPGFCVRQADGTFVTHLDAPIEPEASGDGEADVQTHTQRIADVMARYVARYPDQWCMLQPVWLDGSRDS
jgi:lauroyl/myristoyl acyltransferase/predicted MFS family arabinose efflux permease